MGLEGDGREVQEGGDLGISISIRSTDKPRFIDIPQIYIYIYIYIYIFASTINFYGCIAAAAAKSLQSSPTLCDPIDGSHSSSNQSSEEHLSCFQSFADINLAIVSWKKKVNIVILYMCQISIG